MIELVRSNDPVFLSWLSAALADAGIEAVVLDSHTAVLEGSISAIQRRVMVHDTVYHKARWILHQAECIRRNDGDAQA